MTQNNSDQEFTDAFYKDAYTTKTTHVGLDMDRIDPLLTGIYLKHPGKFVGCLVKQHGIQLIICNNLHGSKR